MLTIVASWLACGPAGPDAPPVLINEVLSRNDRAWVDPDGPGAPEPGECPEHDDYVELYNPGDAAAPLAGYVLADTSGEVLPLTGTVPPHGHLVVVADGQPAQGPLHAPFGVSADGERLQLMRGGTVVDAVDVPALEPDTAYGRYGDGGPAWRIQRAASPGAANEAPPPDPCLLPQPGFDDHTVDCIGTPAGFLALSEARAGTAVVKFDILGFQQPARRHVVFLDSRFYALHDEWYLFRMLNGHAVEGELRYPPYDGDFASIGAIYDWAAGVDLASLFPRDFVTQVPSGRITSYHYYELALGDPRVIGVGTLLHAEAVPGLRDEVWAFELEYSDTITHDDLVGYFETLDQALDADIAGALHWLVRSPDQEALAQQMEAEGLAYADRILRYDALTAPGAVEVYNEGTVAGRVRVLRPGQPLGDATDSDVLVLPEIPDELPPCAALITAVPQTPLAHVALLARSRGIPNLHVGGLADDPQWDQWSRVGAKVAIRATAPDGFEVVALQPDEWATWLSLQEGTVPTLDPVDGSALPWTLDPEALAPAEVPGLRPAIGGKSAGFALLAASGVPHPEQSLAITMRVYQAQIAAMGFVDDLLGDLAFATPGDPRGRWLLLEGQGGYADRFASDADAVYAETFLAGHPADTPLGALVRGGGLRARFDAEPLAPGVLDALLPALQAEFGAYAATQPLRFRSSSSVEDVEGFVGAGLYLSESGWLDPEGAGEPERTVERAIMTVFGSYWGFEAVEERHAARIPHEDGAMGLLVHAAFQDELEAKNGVITATRWPDGRTALEVDAQAGAVSVTNPPTGGCVSVLPEVSIVTSEPRIERRQASTERDGAEVMSDDELLALLARGEAVLDTWLATENGTVPPAQARDALVLDLEFRGVDPGWPEQADASALPARLVLKQARSLEPSAAGLPEELAAAPFPRDVLARARWVTEVTCTSASHEVVALEALTDPQLPPDLGYAEVPFTAQLVVDGLAWDHLDWGDDVAHPDAEGWSLDVGLPDGRVTVAGGTLDVGDGAEPADCSAQTLWASPDTFLDDLL
ncbi:MAG: lamin tail domain-containing protein [Myxococcota bacterium]